MELEEPVAAIIFAGGEAIEFDVIEDLPEGAFVIAADSGLDQAARVGLQVDLIVGDLDSVSHEGLAGADGIPMEVYARDKDFTDMELALDAAARLDVDRIIVVGGHGGRLDHHLANAAVIAAPRFANRRVEWLAGDAHVFVVHGTVGLHGNPGAILSLVAVGGPATGVTTTGLRWPLTNATLDPWSARGVSNEFSRPYATVTAAGGSLLAILPEGSQ